MDLCYKDKPGLWVLITVSRCIQNSDGSTLAFAWACRASTSPASPDIMEATCASQQKEGTHTHIYIYIYIDRSIEYVVVKRFSDHKKVASLYFNHNH